MKKVFEGMAWKLDSLGAWPTGDFAKIMVGFENHRVRITVEDLPEIKPEKNCGNCGAGHTGCKTEPGKTYCSAWQPKPAEPQGWEQRLKAQFPDAYGGGPLMAFIRAEIERVREEEKQKLLDFLAHKRKFSKIIEASCRQIEQDRRGGEK
jgi:hypothetical protein